LSFEILTYGRDELRTVADPVGEVTDAVRAVAREMLEAMYAANGLGLAAEQVGRSEALCVIDVPAEMQRAESEPVPMPLVLADPEITASRGEQCGQEGCLSFPEIYVDVMRAAEVEVSYTDLANRRRTLRATGLLARAIQHELDHLHGVLLVDRMSAVQKVAVSGKLKRLKKQNASCRPAPSTAG
jgi:peptide deformylase